MPEMAESSVKRSIIRNADAVKNIYSQFEIRERSVLLAAGLQPEFPKGPVKRCLTDQNADAMLSHA